MVAEIAQMSQTHPKRETNKKAKDETKKETKEVYNTGQEGLLGWQRAVQGSSIQKQTVVDLVRMLAVLTMWEQSSHLMETPHLSTCSGPYPGI